MCSSDPFSRSSYLVCFVSPSFPSPQLSDKHGELTELWGELTRNAAARKKKLDESYDFQRFVNDLNHSLSWIADIKSLINAEVLANDVASADALLHRHAEHKSEIDARQESFRSLTEFGDSLIINGHFAADELQTKLDQLRAECEALDALWKARKSEFDQVWRG